MLCCTCVGLSMRTLMVVLLVGLGVPGAAAAAIAIGVAGAANSMLVSLVLVVAPARIRAWGILGGFFISRTGAAIIF